MLTAYGLVDQSVASLALRLAAAQRRLRLARAALANQHRSSGGALFAEIALRDGRWAVTVVPHWRGRRCRYHFADYVLLDRRDGIPTRNEAHRVFAEAFEQTAAEWDDVPFPGEPIGEWKQGRLYVPRLAAARAPEPYATVLDDTAGVVIAGPRWAGMYTVAALVAEALGWGRESFEMLARSLNPGGGPSVLLADELLRGWLADRSDNRCLVWAHILADRADGGHASEPASDVRLLANAPPDVQVVLILPADDGPGSGLEVAAEIGGTTPVTLRASTERWRAAIPERPGVVHLTVPTPVNRSGHPAGRLDPGFLDSYFDSGVEVALRVLARLGRDAEQSVRALVPREAVASGDPFAVLAATAGQASAAPSG
jgi:hypothetical protein